MYDERLKSLTDNEKYIATGFDDADSDDGNEDFEDDDEDENPNATFANVKNALMGMKNGKPTDGEFSDDSDDPDYEETAGEYALYDSPLEMTDELI